MLPFEEGLVMGMFGRSRTTVVRNCSTQRMKASMMEALGSESEDGRYFETKSSPDDIRAYCSENGLYVRETKLGSCVVMDVMKDRTAAGYGERGRKG